MKFCYKDRFLDWRIVGIVFLLIILHAMCVKSNIAHVIAIIELLVLASVYIIKRIDDYLLCMTVIFVATYEFPMFVDTSLSFIPSVSMLPFLRGYAFLFLSILPIVILLRERMNLMTCLSKNVVLRYLFYFAGGTLLSGLLMGIISLFNDATSFPFRISFYFKDIIRIGTFSLYTLYFIYACIRYKDFVIRLERLLFSSLVAIILSSIVLTLIGRSGDYEGREIILMPLSFFFSCFIILFFFYKRYARKYRWLLFFLAIISIYLQFMYSNALNGKSWLAILYIIIVALIIGFRKHRIKFLICLVILFLCIPSIQFMSNRQQSQDDSLSSSKLSQALLLVSIIDVDWYDNLPLSPKIRVEEFINTFLEYEVKPYYFLVGKGFGGGHQDHRGIYGDYNSSAFSLEEYNNEYFISMHESLNVVFLKFGIVGLLSLLCIVYQAWHRFSVSPWIVIGALWLLLFWGYSFSLMFIGLPSLIVGLNEDYAES